MKARKIEYSSVVNLYDILRRKYLIVRSDLPLPFLKGDVVSIDDIKSHELRQILGDTTKEYYVVNKKSFRETWSRFFEPTIVADFYTTEFLLPKAQGK